MPRAAQAASSASTLASRPRMGSPTSPVRRPSLERSVLARASWKPRRSASGMAKARKPPETRIAWAPRARIVARSAGPPGMRVMRVAQHPVDGGDGEALQERHALAQRGGEVDLAVHGAGGDGGDLRRRRPASSASSSMHSCRIMVESMSAIRRRMRGRRAGWTRRSTPCGLQLGPGLRQVARARRRSRTRRPRPATASARGRRGRRGPGERKPSTRASGRPPGAATKVATGSGSRGGDEGCDAR